MIFLCLTGYSVQFLEAEDIFKNSDSTPESVSIIKCPQCGLEDSEGNRYCLNCAQEIRTISEDEAKKVREESERLGMERQRRVAEISRREAMNHQQRVVQEQQAEVSDAETPEEPDFPTSEEYKELRKKNIKNTKNISRKLKKGGVVNLRDLTPVNTSKGIFYHRDELVRAHLLQASYGQSKEYYSREEVIGMIGKRIMSNG